MTRRTPDSGRHPATRASDGVRSEAASWAPRWAGSSIGPSKCQPRGTAAPAGGRRSISPARTAARAAAPLLTTVGRYAVTPWRTSALPTSWTRCGLVVRSTPEAPLTCRSTKPGTTHLPDASSVAAAGRSTCADAVPAGTTALIRPSVQITSASIGPFSVRTPPHDTTAVPLTPLGAAARPRVARSPASRRFAVAHHRSSVARSAPAMSTPSAAACDSTSRNRSTKRSAHIRSARSGSRPSSRATEMAAARTSPISASRVAGRGRGVELGELVVDDGPDLGAVGEVQAGRRRLLLHLDRQQHRRQGGQAVHDRAAPLLDPLDLLPVRQHLPGGVGPLGAEDVGMAADELLVDGPGHVGEVERAPLGAERGVEHDLEEQIAELLGQLVVAGPVRPVEPVDGLHHLIALLEQVAGQALVRLLAVPGALDPQAADELDEALHLTGDRRRQLRDPQRREVVGDDLAVELRPRDLEDGLVGRPEPLQDGDRRTAGGLVAERQLDVGQQVGRVGVGDEEGPGPAGRLHRELVGVDEQGALLDGVHAERRPCQVEERHRRPDVDVDPPICAQQGHAALEHGRRARDGVGHVAVLAGTLDHPFDDRPVHAVERRTGLVQVVARLGGGTRRCSRVAPGAQHDRDARRQAGDHLGGQVALPGRPEAARHDPPPS